MKVEIVQGKQVPLEWTVTSRGLLDGGTTLEFLSTFCGECVLLRCDGNAGNSFPTKQGNDP